MLFFFAERGFDGSPMPDALLPLAPPRSRFNSRVLRFAVADAEFRNDLGIRCGTRIDLSDPGQLRNLRCPLDGIVESCLAAQLLLIAVRENSSRNLRDDTDVLAFNLGFQNGTVDFVRFI
jgi:hypothetical protein